MNTSAIRIWYDNGSVDEVHLPDPAFENGVVIQREYIDFSNPDSGIFVERSYVGEQDGGEGSEPFRVLVERTMVVSPEELSHALLVQSHGVEVLRREPWAKAACNMAVTAQSELGFKPSAAQAGTQWLAEGLAVIAAKLHALGERGDAIIGGTVRGVMEGEEG